LKLSFPGVKDPPIAERTIEIEIGPAAASKPATPQR
jgi:hypothetical protein